MRTRFRKSAVVDYSTMPPEDENSRGAESSDADGRIHSVSDTSVHINKKKGTDQMKERQKNWSAVIFMHTKISNTEEIVVTEALLSDNLLPKINI